MLFGGQAPVLGSGSEQTYVVTCSKGVRKWGVFLWSGAGFEVGLGANVLKNSVETASKRCVEMAFGRAF